MPRYYFHISGGYPSHDADGRDLPDDRAAWCEATRLARDIQDGLEPGDHWLLYVLDGNDPVFVLTVASRRLR